MKKLAFPIFVLCLFISLYGYRHFFSHKNFYQKMQSGSLLLATNDTFPFLFENQSLIIESKDKNRYLLDSGLPCLLDKKFADKNNYLFDFQEVWKDDSGKVATKEWRRVDKWLFGRSSFDDIPAAIVDMDKSPELKKLNIVGVVGANLMQHATWTIDYGKKTIVISTQSLDLKDFKHKIPFQTNIVQTPKIAVQVNGFPRKYFAFLSTGYSGGLQFDETASRTIGEMLYDKKAVLPAPCQDMYVFSPATDTCLAALTAQMTLAGQPFEQVPTVFVKNFNTRLGNEFLKNYTLHIDWKKQIIVLW